MDDKDIKKILKDMKNNMDLEEEIIKLEEDIFFEGNIPKLEEEDKIKIKNMTHEKIYKDGLNIISTSEDKKLDSSNIKNTESDESKKTIKFYNRLPKKSMKIASITALIIGAIAIGYPIGASIIDKFYNYVPNEGGIVQSTGDVYILENPITEVIDGKEIKLETIILDLGNKTITTKVIGKNIMIKDNATIKIGDKIIESDGYSQFGGGVEWTTSHGFKGEFEYKDNEEIKYIVSYGYNKNLEFTTNLKKVESTTDYKNLGNTDIKNNIAITAICSEKDNILDVNFISKVEGNTTNVTSYGKRFYKDDYDTGVILRDNNGKIVKGKLVHHGDRSNNYQFDTANLIKPYTIEIPSVNINMFGILEGEQISLKLPSKGSIKVDKEVDLKKLDEFIVTENNKVIIKSIDKIEGNQYKINFEFPKNNNSSFKIVDLDVDAFMSRIGAKADFTGYSSDFNIDTEALESIIFEPENKHKKSVKFKLYPYEYKVEGGWSIKIGNKSR